MIPFVENLISPLQNCEATVLSLCQTLQISVTRTTLVNEITKHPDYPSMLSISDVMRDFRVDNISMKVENADRLSEFFTPFIVQIKLKDEYYPLFALILKLTKDKVTWINPVTRKQEDISLNYFKSMFTRFVQVYEENNESGEKEYSKNRRSEKSKNYINNILLFVMPILTFILCVTAIYRNGSNAITSVIYTFLVLAGVIASAILLMFEIDQYNPGLQKVCRGGEKMNCGAVLQSKGSKIFGIHWVVIGFSYFMGVLAVLLAGGIFSSMLLSAAAWVNVCVLPYTIYSIYYQGRIVKQWCPLCLAVQVVLILLFLNSISGNLLSIPTFSCFSFLPFIVSFSLVFLSVYLLLPALEKNKAFKNCSKQLQRLKLTPEVFKTLLYKQKKITESTKGLGITLGNPNGKIKLIKVCNPYCGPCAKAHPIIDQLLDNNPEIMLQIIFTTSAKTEMDKRLLPVKHFMAIAKKHDVHFTQKILDDWYLNREQTYEEFSKKYPVSNEELNAQIVHIKEMQGWCEKIEIRFTPTIFINNYQLPELYSVTDLRYFLSV